MTPQQFAKLPRYAQNAFHQERRSKHDAEEKIRRLTDTQTKTKIWVEDYGAEIDHQREYVQGDAIVIAHAGVCLKVTAYRDQGIELSWSEGDCPYGTGDVAFIPTSYQQARLTAVENMHTNTRFKGDSE